MEIDLSTKMLFGLILFVMVAGYFFIFSVPGVVGRKKRSDAQDSATIAEFMKRKHEDATLRAEEEERIEHLKEEIEHEQQSGEHVYPTHKTKKDRIEQEYHVGEEKENIFPEPHSRGPNK